MAYKSNCFNRINYVQLCVSRSLKFLNQQKNTILLNHTEILLLGPSIKDVRSQGEGGLSSADILRIRRKGVLQMRTSSLYDAKKFGFFKIFGVSARTRRVEPVQTFYRREGVNFSRFCADVLYGRPLLENCSIKLSQYFMIFSFFKEYSHKSCFLLLFFFRCFVGYSH